MGLKGNASLVLFFFVNLLFYALVSAHGTFPPNPKPKPMAKLAPSPSPSTSACPTDVLKFGMCTSVLDGLLNMTTGDLPVAPCCSLFQGLADFEAATCLCIAFKANMFGMNINIPLSMSLLLNVCSKSVPPGYQCS
ncbi:14 kDa proline-rich protein DC2.15-like [Diospyros lotus]|uniref:14 kDa proline-rich protein DC2.15-like n=1 Tax=Diospyros lotus TaxID=55363 RepID=UPI00225158FC|nr:14 kDa proline-rich protein DC2.15-like [Diospyros lotus]